MGAPTRLPGIARAAGTARAARALAAVAILAMVTAGAADVAAASPLAPRPDAKDITGLTVQVVGDIPATADSRSTFGVSVDTASTLEQVDGVSLGLAVTDAPFASDDDLAAFLESPDAAPVHAVTAAPATSAGAAVGTVRVGASASTSLAVGPGGLGLPAGNPGVYGVVLTLRVGSEQVWTRAAALTWEPAELPQLNVTVVASISGPPGRVEALLAAAGDDRVTLAVDPSALTADQVADLEDRDVYALPAGDLDVSSAAHAQAPALIDAAVARGAQALDAPWMGIAGVADDATMAAASAAGAAAVLTDARWAIVSAPAAGGIYAPVAPEGSGAFAPLVVVDTDLSTTLASKSPADPSASGRLVAQAAFAAIDGRGSVVVSPGDSWVVDSTRESRSVAALLDAPFVTPLPLSAVLATTTPEPIDLPDVIDASGDVLPQQVVAAVSALGALDVLASATTAPSAMIDTARSGIFSSFSLAERADATHREGAIADALAAASAVQSAVAVTSGSQLLLVSSSGSVPITVRNGLDVPVSVRVAVTSRSPILVSKGSSLITIDAGSEATVKVPVTAVSSGDVSVSVALRTDEGSTVAVAETLKVRVRAAWGSTATGIVTVGLAVLLVAGVVRTIRRGRKDTRILPDDDAAVAGARDVDA